MPPDQVIDTVDLYFIRSRQRRLSLRFLAWFVLQENIQTETHDSIEDALSALRLYKTYIKLEEEGKFDQKLEEIYREGKQYVSSAATPASDSIDGGRHAELQTPTTTRRPAAVLGNPCRRRVVRLCDAAHGDAHAPVLVAGAAEPIAVGVHGGPVQLDGDAAEPWDAGAAYFLQRVGAARGWGRRSKPEKLEKSLSCRMYM